MTKTQTPGHIMETNTKTQAPYIPAKAVDDDELYDYILAHIDAESQYLKDLYRATNQKLLRPRMASGHLQGRTLKMLVAMARPQNILEIGTYSGYASLCLAEGLSEGGRLYTFEINDELEDFTRPWIENSPCSSRITYITGDALELAPKLGITFDMAYIDGDKRKYTDYYAMVMKILSKGGYIIADNTLWNGNVTKEPKPDDMQTKGILAFNDMVANDKTVEKVILPLRDGLTVIRKL